jgi:hypothetical protein
MRAYRRRKREKSSRAAENPTSYAKAAELTPPTKTTTNKNKDDNTPQSVTLTDTPPVKHPKLRNLLQSRRLEKLLREFEEELVRRAILQADLQYAANNGIRNAYGLIYTMCRDGFDDDLLREHEEMERRRREREEQARRLRELQDRGCIKCGWWDVDLSGTCFECRTEGREEL